MREAGHEVAEDAAIAWDPNRPALPRARCSLRVLLRGRPRAGRGQAGGAAVGADPRGAGRRGHGARAGARVRGPPAPRARASWSASTASTATRRGRSPSPSRPSRARASSGSSASTGSSGAYLAIVQGTPRAAEGVVDAPIRDAWEGGRDAVSPAATSRASPRARGGGCGSAARGRAARGRHRRPAGSTRSACTSRTWACRCWATSSTLAKGGRAGPFAGPAPRCACPGRCCTPGASPSRTRSRARRCRSRARCPPTSSARLEALRRGRARSAQRVRAPLRGAFVPAVTGRSGERGEDVGERVRRRPRSARRPGRTGPRAAPRSPCPGPRPRWRARRCGSGASNTTARRPRA